MARKKSRKTRPAVPPKARKAWGKQVVVGLAILVVAVVAVLGLRYYRQMGLKEEAGLYWRGPTNAPIVLREFSSFT